MPLKWRTAGKRPLPQLCDRNKQHQVQSWRYRANSCLSTNFLHNIEQILCFSKKLVPKGEYTSIFSCRKTHSFIPLSAFSFLLGLGFTELHKPTNYRSMYLILLLMLYSGSNSMLNDTPLLLGENLCLFPSVTKKWLMVHWAHRFSLIVSVTFQREAAGASEIKKPLWKCLNKPVVWWCKLSPDSQSAWAWPGS